VRKWLTPVMKALTLPSGGGKPCIGIVTTNKSWLDTVEAMADLGVEVFKVGLVCPPEPESLVVFAR